MITAGTLARWRGNALKRTLQDNWHLAQLSYTDEVVPLIDAFATEMSSQGYPTNDIFGMRLSLEEALVNAIKHGHRYDPTKRVSVRYCVKTERVLVEVRDQGSGFDSADVPDPTTPNNWERPSGRGLLLMRRYTSWLRFNARGNCVRLCKYRTMLLSTR
jgi:serine/threonine-protein kinase RsbW